MFPAQTFAITFHHSPSEKNKNFTQSNNLRKRPRGSNKFYKNCTQHKNAKTLCVRVNNSAKPINLLLAKSVSSTVSLARKTLSHTALQNPKFVNFFFLFLSPKLASKGKKSPKSNFHNRQNRDKGGGRRIEVQDKNRFSSLFFLGKSVCVASKLFTFHIFRERERE